MIKKKHINKALMTLLIISGSLMLILTLFQNIIFSLTRNPASDDLLTIYYHKKVNDKVACGTVYSYIATIPPQDKTIEKTVSRIVSGPNEVESKLGFVSFFSQETKEVIRSIKVENKTVYIDLYDIRPLFELSSNPLKLCAKSTIVNTLIQTLNENFPEEVDKVVFAIQGDPQKYAEWSGIGCGLFKENCPTDKFSKQSIEQKNSKVTTLSNKVSFEYPVSWFTQLDSVVPTEFDDNNLITKSLISSKPITETSEINNAATRIIIIEKKGGQRTPCNTDSDECVQAFISGIRSEMREVRTETRLQQIYLVPTQSNEYIIIVEPAYNNSAHNEYLLSQKILESITIEK